MRTLQEIFNIVIEHQLYYPSHGMCSGLYHAAFLSLITIEERNTARCHIRDYLNYLDSHAIYLSDGLLSNDLPNSGSDLLNIYMNWDSRPFPPILRAAEHDQNSK